MPRKKKNNNHHMQKLHDKLMQQGGTYAKWHKHPHSAKAQWLILLAVVVVVGYGLIQRMDDLGTYGLFGSAQNERAENRGQVRGYSQDHVLVQFTPGLSQASINAKLSARASAKLGELACIGVLKVKVPKGLDAEEF